MVPSAKLKRIPDAMPDDVAATFSLNAQRAYSIVRRLRLHDGARVVVVPMVGCGARRNALILRHESRRVRGVPFALHD